MVANVTVEKYKVFDDLKNRIMGTSLGFLKQTALDYDLPLTEVKRVYEKYRGVEFYKALEQLLVDRRNSNCA